MKFLFVSAAIVIASSFLVVDVSAFAPPLLPLSQGTKKCGGGLVFLNAATLETAEETKTIGATNVAVITNGDAAESTSTTAPAVEKAWPVMSDNFVKDSDRVLP